MKKFRFPLHTVAAVRSLAELRAREKFSEALSAFVDAENRLREVRALLTHYEELMRSDRNASFRVSDQVSFLIVIKEETVKSTQLQAEVATARQALEVARQAWLEARRGVRIVENLESKARLIHRHELEREEQLALDDRTNAMQARTIQLAS